MSFRTVLHRQHGLGYNYIDVVPPHYCRFKCVLSLIFIKIPSSTNYVSWIIFHFHFLFCFMGLIRNSLIIFLGIFYHKNSSTMIDKEDNTSEPFDAETKGWVYCVIWSHLNRVVTHDSDIEKGIYNFILHISFSPFYFWNNISFSPWYLSSFYIPQHFFPNIMELGSQKTICNSTNPHLKYMNLFFFFFAKKA